MADTGDEFLNLSLSCGDWSGSSHQSNGKESASYSYNNQKPVNDEPYYSPYTSSSSYFTNLLPQQQENDEFLNLSLSVGNWSGSSHQSKGKEPASYSFNNQKPVNDEFYYSPYPEPYYSPYTSSSTHYPHNTGSSSYFTNLVPQQQENDAFLNLSLSCDNWCGSYHQSKGKEPVNQKPAYDGFGADESWNSQAPDHVSTQLMLGRDSWTTMQDSTNERKD